MKKEIETLKDLFEEMLNHDDMLKDGLCYTVKQMSKKNWIDFILLIEARNYINSNPPNNVYFKLKVFGINLLGSKLYWPLGNVKSRKRWLAKQIRKLS